MTCGIYKITSPTGKVYIGQSLNVESRIAGYRTLSGCKKQRRLYNSLKSHGAMAHVFELVEECLEAVLLDKERYWQDIYASAGELGLNCRLTASGDRAGKHSPESIALMRLKQAGANNPNYGKRGPQTSAYGRKRTEAERAAIKAFQATRGQIIQRVCTKSGVVLQEAKGRDYAVEGYSQGNISSCCTGRLKTHKGFRFQYKAAP